VGAKSLVKRKDIWLIFISFMILLIVNIGMSNNLSKNVQNSYYPVITINANGNPDPFFNVTLLCPNTNPLRIEWANMIKDDLAKIGIGATIDLVNWNTIGPRTWSYPGPYPIPSHDQGGYDMLFIGFNYETYYEETADSLFHGLNIPPAGDNYYQFNDSTYNAASENFNQSFLPSDCLTYASQMQNILHEKLPSILLINRGDLYLVDDSLEGVNIDSWQNQRNPIENWTISGQTEFRYASPWWFYLFNPLLDVSRADTEWMNQVWNGLVQKNESLSGWEYRIADNITTTDGLTYTIELDPNAVWADGTILTTDDVIYSYQLAVTPALNNSKYEVYSRYWDNNSMVKIDNYNMNITFTSINPYIYEFFRIPLIPKHIWDSVAPGDFESTAQTWAETNVSKLFGCGPYKVNTWDTTTSIINLTTNDYFDDWFGSAPKFQDIAFVHVEDKDQAVANYTLGKIDMASNGYWFLTDNELEDLGIPYQVGRSLVLQELGINQEHPYLGTGESCPIPGEQSANYLRKAVAQIINYTHIIENITDNLAVKGSTHFFNTPYVNTSLVPYSYNLTKAEDYVMYAGFDSGRDSDGDGLSDFVEWNTTLTDRFDPDTDGDLMLDGWEVQNGLNPFVDDSTGDPDVDGINNYNEYLQGTDPQDSDSDDDLMPDGWEVNNSLNPLVDDAAGDPDLDTLTNYDEYLLGTDPHDSDTDADGINDGEEVVEGADGFITDPLDSDSDDDGIEDGEESIVGVDGYVTDPNNPDTDGDGLTDDEEIAVYQTDPTVADSDGDGFTDLEEINKGRDPNDPEDRPFSVQDLTTTESIISLAVAGTTAVVISGLAIGSQVVQSGGLIRPRLRKPSIKISPKEELITQRPKPEIQTPDQPKAKDPVEEKPKQVGIKADDVTTEIETAIKDMIEDLLDEKQKGIDCLACGTKGIGPFCYVCGTRIKIRKEQFRVKSKTDDVMMRDYSKE